MAEIDVKAARELAQFIEKAIKGNWPFDKWGYLEQSAETILALCDRLEAAEKDVRRYRELRVGITNGDEWIRIVGSMRGSGSLSLTGEHADDFIDRAIAQRQGE
ncbi:hypothetical protein WJ85_17360 [Burkholderia ubonensis]|uniref:hypothetical protein n=1 Tax=Burkholderia ubonensis TaxID=101571 RepID=UPI00075227E5|nr:hypothetical protein [Burkholderia ubonensis]KVP11997.1 hypothetical protein WJ85_17360 [Burkholderia ubonensis]